ncbi:UDP-2,3-diacylglucosamine diphosphatase [Bacteroidia bacterium]|jgi:UDP-2,3-diacylglucosamine hydrolase|nr:UDP-2,3-diacylglucosamine diphosphatase [Bacteroidia bacterium]
MKKTLFASDFHLGIPSADGSRLREKKIVNWLTKYQKEVDEIYFLGDVFDFWFEYKRAIPKGYSRLFGKLAELADAGVALYFFKGNHDMWMFDYFEKEFGATIISNELEKEIKGKKFYIHHGDGLGPGDTSYKFLKKFFRSGFCQWLFARLHPNFGIGIAQYFSNRSRLAKGQILADQGANKEAIQIYFKELDRSNTADFYLCGHRHLPIEMTLPNGGKYINTGDWFFHYTYALFDGTNLTLREYEENLIA